MELLRRTLLASIPGLGPAATVGGRPTGRARARPRTSDPKRFRVEWIHRVDGVPSGSNHHVVPAGDGGYYFSVVRDEEEQTERTGLVARVDADGRRRWLREVAIGPDTDVFGLTPAAGGGVVVAGNRETETGDQAPYVLRLSGDGEAGEPALVRTDLLAKVRSLAVTGDRYTLAGTHFGGDAPNHRQGWVQRVTPGGEKRGAATFQFDGMATIGHVCLPAEDSGVYVLAETYGETQAQFVTRFDGALDRRWTYRFDHTDPNFYRACRHRDGGIVVATDSDTDRFTRLTADGTVAWTEDSRPRKVTAIDAGPDGTILFAEHRWRGSDYVPGLGKVTSKRDHKFGRYESEDLARLTALHVESGGDFVATASGWSQEAGNHVDLVRFRNPAPDPTIEVLRPVVAGESTWLHAKNAERAPRGHLTYTWSHDGEVLGEGEDAYPVFESPGEREVTLRAVDEFGKVGETTRSVTVEAAETPTPTSTATPSPPPGSATPNGEESPGEEGATVPGFGIGSALAGLTLGATLERLRRRRE